MNITEIEKLSFEQAKELSEETIVIKGHDCMFAELGKPFGYSVLVFKDGKYIYYANDYESHHPGMVNNEGKGALREFYIKKLQRKLYTDEELLEPIQSYDEYKQKDYFLRNYWIMRYDYVSIFGINEFNKAKIANYPFMVPVCFCYVRDGNIVTMAMKYSAHLEREYRALLENADKFREMIAFELANHEAFITCRYTETLDSLGLKFNELSHDKKAIVIEELKKQIDKYNL